MIPTAPCQHASPKNRPPTVSGQAPILVTGACHMVTGGDQYLMANRPSKGSRATREVMDHPTRDNVRRYLRVHLDDEALGTDELVEYIYQNHTGHPDHEGPLAVGERHIRPWAFHSDHHGAAIPTAAEPQASLQR